MTTTRKVMEPSRMRLPSSQIGGSSGADTKIAGLYDLEDTLGSGHFAIVKRAKHVFTGAEVAVKVVDKTKLDEVSKSHLFQEVRCMKLVQHPNVVRLYEVIDTQTKLYLVLELGDGGDLYDYIMKHEHGLSEDLARKYFCQILRAIRYCHQLHVVHRDLKPENVVFFEKLGIVKLTDFGFSNKFSPGQKLETFCGSLAYSAPEILLGDSYDAPAVDIWSLGVILYMLVCGQTPFDKANDSETLTMIMDCKYTVPPNISANCRDLIATMLVRDPNGRATLDQIANSSWVKQNIPYDSSDILPLISRQELSEEDHSFILQKMINGNIASKEEILQSLDKNIYNHITATYYLLAEMRLRKQREEQMQRQRLNASLSAAANNDASKPVVPPEIILTATVPIDSNLVDTKPEKRNRKCSVVREEDEEDSSRELSDGMDKLKVATRRESISDGRLNQSIQEHTGPMNQLNPCTAAVIIPTTLAAAPLLTKKAMPLGRHQITKEDLGFGEPASTLLSETKTIRESREIESSKLKGYSGSNKHSLLPHRRTKFNKVRTPSCSSSEASDDDTKSRNKKKLEKIIDDAPIRFQMHRRDSHDDSSDSQDPTIPPPGSTSAHSQTATLLSKCDTRNSKNQHKSKNNTSSAADDKTHSHANLRNQSEMQINEENSNYPNFLKPNLKKPLRRQRIRESQSLDRITEAQENELRHRSFALEAHMEQICALCSRYSSSEENSISSQHRTKPIITTPFTPCSDCQETLLKKHRNSLSASIIKLDSFVPSADSQILPLKNIIHNISNNNISNSYCNKSINSFEDINLILDEQNLKKAISITGSKCFVTIKKVCKLGKYFSDINFS